jgi:hypothetical protein
MRLAPFDVSIPKEERDRHLIDKLRRVFIRPSFREVSVRPTANSYLNKCQIRYKSFKVHSDFVP